MSFLDRYEVNCADCGCYSDRYFLRRGAERQLAALQGQKPGFRWYLRDHTRDRRGALRAALRAAGESLLVAMGWRRH